MQDAGWLKKGMGEEKNNICLKTKVIIGELETDEGRKEQNGNPKENRLHGRDEVKV